MRKHPYRLLITQPDVADSVPKFERGDTFVYDAAVLLRSWWALYCRADATIRLPGDLSLLIEQVYGNEPLPTMADALQVAVAKADVEMRKELIHAEDEAYERMVREPSYKKLLTQMNMGLEEDNADLKKAFRALTRLGDSGVNVVCLHRVNSELLFDAAVAEAKYRPNRKPNKETVRQLLRQSVGVRHFDPSVEVALLTNQDDEDTLHILAQWKRIAALKYHRVVIFEAGRSPLQGTPYVMVLDRRLGLRIEKEG